MHHSKNVSCNIKSKNQQYLQYDKYELCEFSRYFISQTILSTTFYLEHWKTVVISVNKLCNLEKKTVNFHENM